jgi:hypothetical protein
MKIAWIFPLDRRDGISIYGRQYAAALGQSAEVVCADPLEFLQDKKAFCAKLGPCALVHIQYETSLFTSEGRDFYEELCRTVRAWGKPVVVTLHEVYSQFPGVFPREAIRGRGLMLRLRQFRYDRRHPLQKALSLHQRNAFYADLIFVHYPSQQTIVRAWGIGQEKIECLPLPVPEIAAVQAAPDTTSSGLLRLGSLGFINPNFNYELLFNVLKTLALPWSFTWIGGVRRREDQNLLDQIVQQSTAAGWHERFKVSGWVSEETQAQQLAQVQIYCAFFKNRSASGSLTLAIAAKRLIVATELPLIREINAAYPVMECVPGNTSAVVAAIGALYASAVRQRELLDGCSTYAGEHSFNQLALTTLERYQARFGR